MTLYKFETLDVFTERRFGGNPLAVFTDARGLTDDVMQAVAAEVNLSETTFILPPQDAQNTARVRIFNRTAEMAFAGHPSVGTGCVLARMRPELGNDLRLEVPAGIVPVTVERDAAGVPVGATITAPQPLSTGGTIEAEVVAACLQIETPDVLLSTHLPIVASMGNPYVIAEVASAALAKCSPDIQKFRDALAARPELGDRFSMHVYSWDGEAIRARMYAPLAGTWEDPATGSANAPLAALLLSLGSENSRKFHIRQGVEMGRPSELLVVAERIGPDIFAHLTGKCVPVFHGHIDI